MLLSINTKEKKFRGEVELTSDLIKGSDLVIVLSAHSKVDYDFVQQNAIAIFDTKNVMSKVIKRDNIELL